MRLSYALVLISFTLLISSSFTSHLTADAREVDTANGNRADAETPSTGRRPADDQQKPDRRRADLKRSQDEERSPKEKADQHTTNSPQIDQPASHPTGQSTGQSAGPSAGQSTAQPDKPNVRHVKFNLDDEPKERDANPEKSNKIDVEPPNKSGESDDEELVDEYIYVKIKAIDSEGNEVFDSEDPSAKDSPIRKTLNIKYDDEGIRKFEEEIDKEVFGKDENDDSKEKEVLWLSNVYPPLDGVKVQFNKPDSSKRPPPEEEEPEPVPEELTPDQLQGKQLFEDALTHLDSNQAYAFKLIDEAATLGYKEAEDFLLHGLVFGEFDVDLDTLKQRLDYMTRKGNPLAQMFYGFFYASGTFFKPSQASALLYYTVSAATNNTYAQMALGYRYWHGINVKQNCQKALKFYSKVAKQVEKTMSTIPGGIIERKRLFDENENPSSYTALNPDMIQYYQVLAENGDTLAQIAVGQIHYQGMRGVPKDHRKALKFLQMAANSKNANAMAYLGKMYLEGSDVIEQNFELAKQYFESAKEKNSAAGYCGLGTMYLHAKGVERDYPKAYKYFTKAAEQGLVEAQYQIGIMYYNGYGVARNYETAFKYFYLASQAGYVLGYYYLAIMHAEGLGTQKSCSNAVELFKNVAERGTWSKILMDAFTDYKEGKVLNSYIKYSFLAELGYEVAQSNAASLLDNHELKKYYSSNESYTRAFMYWSRSATQGYSVARVKLGDYYYYGQGINVDYELAAAQYRLASDRSAQALFNLGYMHEQGLGLKKDFYLAKRYYDQAADSSYDASIPVLLAKIKLYTVYFFERLNELSFEDMLIDAIDYIVFEEWDLYLLTFLVVLLGVILRRNRG